MAKAAKKFSFASSLDKAFKTIKSPTFGVGFTKLNMWIDLGNYALNRIMSGRFDKALLFGRKYIFYGESGSGKSLLAAIACGNAQRSLGAHVVWIDIEKANDQEEGERWLKNAGVDIDPDKGFHYLRAGTVLDVRQILSTVCNGYREQTEAGEVLPPIVIVVDSWAMVNTEIQMEAAKDGELKHDRGLRIQEIGQIIIDCVHMSSGLPILIIGVQHVMDGQDPYGPKHKTTGGNKMLYAASGCLLLTKKQLKSGESDDRETVAKYKTMSSMMTASLKKKFSEGKKIIGITCVAENIKSRASKPFEKIEIQIPYLTGIDPYSGLFDVMMSEGVITTESTGWYQYKNKDGEVVKFQMGKFREHAPLIMKVMQEDISNFDATAPAVVSEVTEEEAGDGE